MKRLLIAVLAILMLSISGHAQEPAAKRNVFVRAVQDIGHQYKSVFTDMNPHGKFGKQWLFMTLTDTAGAAADWTTSCRGMIISNGQLHDHLIGSGSCSKFLAIAIPIHITSLAATHGYTEGFVNICKADANNPNGRWNKIDAASHDPNSCRYIMWATPIAQLPINYWNTRNNVDLTNQYQLVNHR